MNNPDTDLIFPTRSISPLCNERDTVWCELVKSVESTKSNSPERMAFILMMARLCNCATCNADSYRAIHGCTPCSKQSLKRFHGSDVELSGLFKAASTEVSDFLKKQFPNESTPLNPFEGNHVL
jgi:hypothetical protein